MNPLERAIKSVKTASALAKALNISPMTISQWRNRDHGVVPSRRVMEIFQLTGVTPHELRPDLYPNPSDGLPAAKQQTTPAGA